MKFKHLIYIGFITLIAFCSSCKNNCYVPMEANLGIAFVDDKVVKPLVLSSLTVKGEGNDSVLYNNASASEIYLPLKINDTITNYKVNFACPTKQDSILAYQFKITHTSYPQYISPECGCCQFFKVESFAATDSLPEPTVLKSEIFNPDVANVDKSIHIKVHF